MDHYVASMELFRRIICRYFEGCNTISLSASTCFQDVVPSSYSGMIGYLCRTLPTPCISGRKIQKPELRTGITSPCLFRTHTVSRTVSPGARSVWSLNKSWGVIKCFLVLQPSYALSGDGPPFRRPLGPLNTLRPSYELAHPRNMMSCGFHLLRGFIYTISSGKA